MPMPDLQTYQNTLFIRSITSKYQIHLISHKQALPFLQISSQIFFHGQQKYTSSQEYQQNAFKVMNLNINNRIRTYMLPGPKPCLHMQLSSKGSNNSEQLSTEFDQFARYPSREPSRYSKKQQDGLVCSTDEEEGAREIVEATEEVVIYGERFCINFEEDASINSFLRSIQGKKNLSPLTQESIKLLILEKAVNWKKQLRPILQKTYEQYEKLVMRSIFN